MQHKLEEFGKILSEQFGEKNYRVNASWYTINREN